MYKIFFIVLFASLVFADDTKVSETEEIFKYSSVHLNENISLYAAEVYMNQIEKKSSYSVGVLLNSDKKMSAEFGLGYLKAAADSMVLLSSTRTLEKEANDGILFFMNYKF